MEFHGTAGVSEIGALQAPWNSMEFHGTARISEIGALQVPKFILNLDRIPWILSFQILTKIVNCIQFCRMNQFPLINKRPISFSQSLAPTYVLF